MTRLVISPFTFALLLVASSFGCSSQDDTISATRDSLAKSHIPSEVRRRIAHAIWPENLFDLTGSPEPGFVERPFRPAFADLRIARGEPIPELPGVVVYAGMAYPSGCSHCGTSRVAVATRGDEHVTLVNPEDIQFLAQWAGREVLADSVRLRRLIMGALRSTCFLGCEIAQITNRADIPDPDSSFLLSAEREDSAWTMPSTSSWQTGGHTVVEFPILARRLGVYAIRAQWSGNDDLFVSLSPVAWYIVN